LRSRKRSANRPRTQLTAAISDPVALVVNVTIQTPNPTAFDASRTQIAAGWRAPFAPACGDVMPQPFLDIAFSGSVGRGATGGPGFSNQIVTLASGAEQRNVNRSQARGG